MRFSQFFENWLYGKDGYYNRFKDIGKKGDFYTEEKYTFEIGGKDKGYKQIKDIENSYIAADDIEVGYGNKIPLWLFGFLY